MVPVGHGRGLACVTRRGNNHSYISKEIVQNYKRYLNYNLYYIFQHFKKLLLVIKVIWRKVERQLFKTTILLSSLTQSKFHLPLKTDVWHKGKFLHNENGI